MIVEQVLGKISSAGIMQYVWKIASSLPGMAGVAANSAMEWFLAIICPMLVASKSTGG